MFAACGQRAAVTGICAAHFLAVRAVPSTAIAAERARATFSLIVQTTATSAGHDDSRAQMRIVFPNGLRARRRLKRNIRRATAASRKRAVRRRMRAAAAIPAARARCQANAAHIDIDRRHRLERQYARNDRALAARKLRKRRRALRAIHRQLELACGKRHALNAACIIEDLVLKCINRQLTCLKQRYSL